MVEVRKPNEDWNKYKKQILMFNQMWPKYQNETNKLHQKVYYDHILFCYDSTNVCKVRAQCFSLKSRFFFLSWKDLSEEYLVIPEFLMPKFKENVLICVIVVKKVRNLLLSLLQVKTMLAA